MKIYRAEATPTYLIKRFIKQFSMYYFISVFNATESIVHGGSPPHSKINMGVRSTFRLHLHFIPHLKLNKAVISY